MQFRKTGLFGLAISLLTSTSLYANNTADVAFLWDPTPGAAAYQLEEYTPSSTGFEPVYVGAETTATLTARAFGDYRYRVIGCIEDDSVPVQLLCNEAVANYSVELPVTLNNKAATRRVIYLHTDLLGSVSSETNEQGALNQ